MLFTPPAALALLLCSPMPLAPRSSSVTCAVPAALMELTFDDIRRTELEELEDLVLEMEAELLNVKDTTGKLDLHLSRMLAVAHARSPDSLKVAAEHASAALEVGGPDAEMHFVRGVAMERRDEQDEALDEYETALAVDPKCWRALFHTAKIALAFGWPADAVDYFKQVAEINPSHAPTKAFLKGLAELDVDVDEWQEENKQIRSQSPLGGGGGGGGGAPPEDAPVPVVEVPDLPEGFGGGIQL